MQGPKVGIQDLSDHSPLHSLRLGLLIEPRVHGFASLASWVAQGSLLLSSELWSHRGYRAHLACLSAGDLNSGPLSLCRDPPTKPSPSCCCFLPLPLLHVPMVCQELTMEARLASELGSKACTLTPD